jgi:hypothetical protein
MLMAAMRVVMAVLLGGYVRALLAGAFFVGLACAALQNCSASNISTFAGLLSDQIGHAPKHSR